VPRIYGGTTAVWPDAVRWHVDSDELWVWVCQARCSSMIVVSNMCGVARVVVHARGGKELLFVAGLVRLSLAKCGVRVLGVTRWEVW
jgi:hypothetical protein